MQATADTANYYFAFNGYIAVETDADPAATFMYYQFVNKAGHWYIMRSEAKSATLFEYKFTKGASDYVTAWTNRTTPAVAYAFPDVMFKDL
jgi:hypothetical protein